MRICVVFIFCVIFAACTRQDSIESRIDLGAISRYKSADFTAFSNAKNVKPDREIARICFSFFGRENLESYNVLSIQNLLLKAKENTGKSSFKNVGIYFQETNILGIWQKRCLILGEDSI